MKETTDTLNDPSYYPSARHMTTHPISDNNILHSQNKPTMEITLYHDQWREASEVNNTSQQQKHLPSVRCTLCKDQNNNIVFYRPSMPLHTLFQTPGLDEPTTTGTTSTRYSKKRYTLDSPDYLSTNDTMGGEDNSNTKNNNNINSTTNGMDDEDEDPQQRLVIPKLRQAYATLYNATNDQALWTFTEQDWHTMTFISRQPPYRSILMTTSTFSFIWENGLCQWRMQLDEEEDTTTTATATATATINIQLVCEQWESNKTKRHVAWLRKDATKLTLFENEDDPMNPNRQLNTFLLLSGLILYELISSQVRTLGGGRDAINMMIERQQLALVEETKLFYQHREQQQQQQQHSGMEEEYPSGDPSRWSSSSSLKSLELDQGWWRCWWTWIPCCMPGSWCDRAWVKTRGVRRYHHRSRVTRRMQGWQEQT